MSARNGFAVTYEIVTEESSREGDAAERGFLDSMARPVPAIFGKPTPGVHMGFREAFELFNQERTGGYIVEADCYPLSAESPPSWFTDLGVIGASWGDVRNVTLHLPESVTGWTAMRIARLVGCYGAKAVQS